MFFGNFAIFYRFYAKNVLISVMEISNIICNSMKLRLNIILSYLIMPT